MSRIEDFSRPWYALALKLIEDLDLRGAKALDLGCGMGEFSRMLRDRGAEVSCADIDEDCVFHVRGLGFQALKVDLEKELPFPTDSFDLAVLLDVVEHVYNTERLLAEVGRILRPTGHLLLSTPNAAFLVERLRFLFGRPLVDEGYHVRFFTFATLRSLLSAAGFEIVKDSSCLPVPFFKRFGGFYPHIALLRWFKPLLATRFVLLCRRR